MKYVLALIFVLTLLSCSNNETNIITSPDLKGKWVDVETRLDTLSFESLDNSEIMNLNRGKEIREGNLLPKYGSGSYIYKVSELNISLNWMLSNNSNFYDYYFKIIENRLNIGNFYGSEYGETLTFEKLK